MSPDEPHEDADALPLGARDALVRLLLHDLGTNGSPGAVQRARLRADAPGDAASNPTDAADARVRELRTSLAAAGIALAAGASSVPARLVRARLDAYARVLAAAPRGDSLGVRLAQARSLFGHGLFFEVHEVLEPPWRDAVGRERTILQGVIQAAVAWHHAQRGNSAGARRLAASALGKLAAVERAWNGFPLGALGASLEEFLAAADAVRSARPPVLAWARDEGYR